MLVFQHELPRELIVPERIGEKFGEVYVFAQANLLNQFGWNRWPPGASVESRTS